VSLADELLSGWAPILRGVELTSGTKGRFEVTLDGELIFSKVSLERHANPGEISAEVERRLGPRLDWRQNH
jgi:selT/selW/selH-like putative selenoprotein